MNIASLTIALNEEELIGGCLDLLDVPYKLVIIPKKTFSGKEIRSFDNTEKIAREKGAVVLFADTESEQEGRNAGLAYLHSLGYEYTLVVDADEYWPGATQREMLRLIANGRGEAYKASMDFFFKRPDWRIEGMKHNRAVVAVRTDIPFSSNRPRRSSGRTEYVRPGPIYHFSYVRRSEKIREKIEAFSHAHEVIPGWFEKVFVPFTPDVTDFHPVHPTEYPKCAPCALPQEIADNLPKHLWSA